MISEATRRRHEEAKKAFKALMKFYPLTTDDLDGELWAPVSYCADYHVSTFGRIKSFKNGRLRIMKPGLRREYLEIELYKDAKGKSLLIHRLVAEAFIPNPDGKPEVNQIDGHKFNCHVSNLEWATHAENIQHAFATGLEEASRGEDNPRARLTNEQVVQIRDNPDGLTGVELAKKFCVSTTAISDIQRGNIYKEAGGTVREKISLRTPDHIREEIRRLYKKGVRGCGMKTLAKKFGLNESTILSIIREGNS